MCEAKWAIGVIGVAAVISLPRAHQFFSSSGGSNEFNLGEGNDVANMKESTGFHFI